MAKFRTLACALSPFLLIAVLGGCGGGGSSAGVDKHITCVFQNNSTQNVAFKMNLYPAFNQVVNAGDTISTNGFELVVGPGGDEKWFFTVTDTKGNTLVQGTFDWTYNQGVADSHLGVNYHADGTLTFNPSP